MADKHNANLDSDDESSSNSDGDSSSDSDKDSSNDGNEDSSSDGNEYSSSDDEAAVQSYVNRLATIFAVSGNKEDSSSDNDEVSSSDDGSARQSHLNRLTTIFFTNLIVKKRKIEQSSTTQGTKNDNQRPLMETFLTLEEYNRTQAESTTETDTDNNDSMDLS